MITRIILLTSKLHGHLPIIFDLFLEQLLKLILKVKVFGSFEQFRLEYVASYKGFPATNKFLLKPEAFIQYMAIIQAPPSGTQKGILTIAYNYAIPSFFYLFKYEEIMKRYHIVLEPSTARFLMPEILICDDLADPVYVQAGEPRDAEFLQRFSKSLIPVPIAANWWLNTQIFNNHTPEKKEFDIIMVSTFTKLKRHYLLFEAMNKLKSEGKLLTAVLIGYQGRYTKNDIEEMAIKAGVENQVVVLDNLSPTEIASYYRRSKINVLLSKREGTPRTMIEGLHCGVPAMLREGFNFGYKYDYMTPKSGVYYQDNSLAEDMLNLIQKVDSGSIDTIELLLNIKINPLNAARILSDIIYPGQNIIVEPKASGLHGMEYINERARSELDSEYDFLLANVNKI
jgi:glycosyltransferase involved in cell wall biosynthesis